MEVKKSRQIVCSWPSKSSQAYLKELRVGKKNILDAEFENSRIFWALKEEK